MTRIHIQIQLQFGLTLLIGHAALVTGGCRKSKITKITPQSIESVRDKVVPALTNAEITATALGHAKISLLWAKGTDETSVQSKLYYKVVGSTSDNINTIDECDILTPGSGQFLVLDWKADITTAIASDLNMLTTYYFNVLVADEAGNKKIYNRIKTATLGWIHEAYLKAPNTSNSDRFGTSVSISNDTVAVGAYWESSNTTGIINGSDLSSTNDLGVSTGAVYVFKRTNSSWALEAYLKAPNGSNSDTFGEHVAISGDTVAVGSRQEDSNSTSIINGSDLSAANNSGSDNGAVYIFKRTGSSWTHEAYLKAPNTTNGDVFGGAIAISNDTVVVGVDQEDSTTTSIIHGSDLSSTNNSGTQNGAAYVFRRSGSTWTHEAYLKAPNNNSNVDLFGNAVAISNETIAVAAWEESSNTTSIINGSDLSSTNNSGAQNGAVYIFKRSGSTWALEAYLKAPNTTNTDGFGFLVAISNDTVVAGSTFEDSNTSSIIHGGDLSSANDSGSDNGAAYVFKRTGSTWVHEAYLKAPNTTNGDFFGRVAISNDTIAVGAFREDSNTTSVINGSDLSATNNSGSNNGAVYVFKRSGSTWTHEAYLKAPNTTNGDNFGRVAISNDTVVVGSREEDSNTSSIIHGSDLSSTNDLGTENGAVYIFR